MRKRGSALVSQMDARDIRSPGLNARQFSHHRWYPMTPMLPVTLVQAYLKSISPRSVLDPFVGIGTTLVEAQHNNIYGIGVDANPFMCLVTSVKTADYDVLDIASEWSRVLDSTEYSRPPSIPRIEKYYDDAILDELLRLKAGITKIRSENLKRLFLVALAYVSIKLANVKMTPAPRFVNNTGKPEDVANCFTEYLERVIHDCNVNDKRNAPIKIVNKDARHLVFLDEKVDCIITSPPYCNNLDYVRHTQLELYWTDLVDSWKGLSPIRRTCITSCEAMAYQGKDLGLVEPHVSKIAMQIRKRTERALPQVVTQYFAGMHQHLASAYTILKPSGSAVYVIGDSWFKDVYIPTHRILGNLAKMVGFGTVKISYLRPRRDPYKRNLGEYVITLAH